MSQNDHVERQHGSNWCQNWTTLVGGLEHDFYFSVYWECHHPNWRTHMFQMDWNHQADNHLGSKLAKRSCCYPHEMLLWSPQLWLLESLFLGKTYVTSHAARLRWPFMPVCLCDCKLTRPVHPVHWWRVHDLFGEFHVDCWLNYIYLFGFVWRFQGKPGFYRWLIIIFSIK